MPIRPYREVMPTLGARVLVDPMATVVGDVVLGDDVSLWPGVVVERHGFIGAGALVTPGKVVGSGELWLGNPARKARMLGDAEIEALYYSAQHYVRLKDEYLSASSP